MKFGASRSQLYDAQKTARAHWQAAMETWTDGAKQDHEEKVWLPWDEGASKVGAARIPMRAKFLTDRKLGLMSVNARQSAISTSKGAHRRRKP